MRWVDPAVSLVRSVAAAPLLWLLAAAPLALSLIRAPVAHGDSGEYFLMIESLYNHWTPEARPLDFSTLGRATLEGQLGGSFGPILSIYQVCPEGRYYSIHFWMYPLFTIPAKFALRVFHLNELKAPQVTNAALLALVLAQIHRATRPSRRQKTHLMLLFVVSPLLWYVLWPHPEVFSACFVALALLLAWEARWVTAVLCAALASTQNPPLLLLVGLLWLRGALAAFKRGGTARLRALGGASLAALPAALSPVFYLLHFGVPSLLPELGAVSSDNLSARKALELFFDLNLGLLPFVPIALLGAIAFGAIAMRRVEALRWGLPFVATVFLVALACTATGNWNHGMSGPSRYAVWLLPFVLVAFLAAQPAGLWGRRLHATAVVLALASQAAVVLSRLPDLDRADHLQHSFAARFLMAQRPAWYRPSIETFAARTLHRSDWKRGPVVYRDERGCRKALARARHRGALLEACGWLPPGTELLFTPEHGSDRDWLHVDWD